MMLTSSTLAPSGPRAPSTVILAPRGQLMLRPVALAVVVMPARGAMASTAAGMSASFSASSMVSGIWACSRSACTLPRACSLPAARMASRSTRSCSSARMCEVMTMVTPPACNSRSVA